MPGAKIGKNCVIEKAVIGEGAKIGDNVRIGVEEDPQSKYISKYCSGGIVLVEGGAEVKDSENIVKNSMIEA